MKNLNQQRLQKLIIESIENAFDDLKDVMNHKEKQLEIILKYNPMSDDYHTGIRNIDDIHTLEEIVHILEENGDTGYITEDLDFADLKDAVETGYITVYSSYLIKQGTFVSTSYLEAYNYAGCKTPYSKNVSIRDIAWIDEFEGQYAKVI